MENDTFDESNTRQEAITSLSSWLRTNIERNYTREVADTYFQYFLDQIRVDLAAGAHYISSDAVAEATSQEYLLREWPRNLETLCEDIFAMRKEAQTSSPTVAGFQSNLYQERIAPFVEHAETLVTLINTCATHITSALTLLSEPEIDEAIIDQFHTFPQFIDYFQKLDTLRGFLQGTYAELHKVPSAIGEGIKRRKKLANAYIPTLYTSVFKDLKQKFDTQQ